MNWLLSPAWGKEMITIWSLTSLGKITYCYRSMLHRVVSVVCPVRRVCICPTLLWWGVAAFSYLVLVIVHRQQIVLIMSPYWLVTTALTVWPEIRQTGLYIPVKNVPRFAGNFLLSRHNEVY